MSKFWRMALELLAAGIVASWLALVTMHTRAADAAGLSMNEEPEFFAVALAALGLAIIWDVISGEAFPSVAGLFVGLILGTMAFG
jgi:hypothetical protein